MDTNPSLRVWLGSIKLLLESTGLKLSPAPFSVQATPKGLIDASFCLDLQTSNTGKYREADELIRISHSLTVRVAKLVKPMDQFTSQLDGLDMEAKIIAVLMHRSNIPDAVVYYESTSRTLTTAREHILTDIRFRIEMDWSWAQVA